MAPVMMVAARRAFQNKIGVVLLLEDYYVVEYWTHEQ